MNSKATKPPNPPVPRACTECRTRHMKCDAKSPVCSRCHSEHRQCQYVQSRRGYKGPRKRRAGEEVDADKETRAAWERNTSEINRMALDTGGSSPVLAAEDTGGRYSAVSVVKGQASQISMPLTVPFSEALYDHDGFGSVGGEEAMWGAVGDGSDDDLGRNCQPVNFPWEKGVFRADCVVNGIGGALADSSDSLNLYYMHFHNSHPILLPRKFLFKDLFERYPPYLKNMMRLIGSQYKANAAIEGHQKAIEQEMVNENAKSGYLVQSLLLNAILHHTNDEQEQAKQTIDTAIEIALDLGMHLEQFAVDNGCGSRHLEECWRRTWWELYVVDGLLKLHAQLAFRRWNLEMGVLLPVDDCADLEMTVPQKTHTLSAFRERAFAKNEIAYSSFAYRIDAVRLIGRILALGSPQYEDENDSAEAIDAALTSWILHLPPSKREVLDLEGRIDEILFQAHMIISTALIYLHRPRSNLVFASVQETTQCTWPDQYLNPVTALHVHAAKAIRAANNLSNLISLPVSLVNHTPFFTCAITLASIIHLAAYSVITYADGGTGVKERIQMEVGAMKSVSEVWPIAVSMLHQIKEVARGVFILDPQGLNRPGQGSEGVQEEQEQSVWISDELWLE